MFRFDFTLKHVSEVRMGKADGLNRRPDLKKRTENENKNQKLIKEEWIREIMEVVVEVLEMMLIEKIKRARGKDEEIVKVVEEMKKAGIKTLRGDK